MRLTFGSIATSFQTRSLTDNLAYTLGRFHLVRDCYSSYRSLFKGLDKPCDSFRCSSVLAEPVDSTSAVKSLNKQAVCLGLELAPDVLSALQRLVWNAPLKHAGIDQAFTLSDIREDRLPSGKPVAFANVDFPEQYDLVNEVAEDPSVIAAVSRYLRYKPSNRSIRIFVSFLCDHTMEERHRLGQTVHFHYDVHSYNFIYANYYLTDTDAQSGAHVMVLGSHKNKPISWLFSAARRSDPEIEAHYERDQILTIDGKAGSGFLQDSSCYHKALAPQNRARILLQVRYF